MELRVDGWRKGVRFAASHIIPGHAQCGRMHGHTYAVHCVLRGEPSGPEGFIVDFNVLGAALQRVADRLDHKLLLPAQHGGMDLKESEREVSFTAAGKRYVLPREDCALLPVRNCTAENLAQHCLDALLHELGPLPNVREVEVGVDEGYGKGAWAQRRLA